MSQCPIVAQGVFDLVAAILYRVDHNLAGRIGDQQPIFGRSLFFREEIEDRHGQVEVFGCQCIHIFRHADVCTLRPQDDACALACFGDGAFQARLVDGPGFAPEGVPFGLIQGNARSKVQRHFGEAGHRHGCSRCGCAPQAEGAQSDDGSHHGSIGRETTVCRGPRMPHLPGSVRHRRQPVHKEGDDPHAADRRHWSRGRSPICGSAMAPKPPSGPPVLKMNSTDVAARGKIRVLTNRGRPCPSSARRGAKSRSKRKGRLPVAAPKSVMARYAGNGSGGMPYQPMRTVTNETSTTIR